MLSDSLRHDRENAERLGWDGFRPGVSLSFFLLNCQCILYLSRGSVITDSFQRNFNVGLVVLQPGRVVAAVHKCSSNYTIIGTLAPIIAQRLSSMRGFSRAALLCSMALCAWLAVTCGDGPRRLRLCFLSHPKEASAKC